MKICSKPMTTSNSRAKFGVTAAAAALITSVVLAIPLARAQVPPAMEQVKPYLQVKPVPGDEETIRVFFTPSCPYSKAYLQFFKNLEATLPKEKTFAWTPLANKEDGIQFVLAFLAVQEYYPIYLDNFVEASLIGAQEKGISTKNWAGIDRISMAAHIPVSVPRLVLQHQAELTKRAEALLIIQKQLQVSNTPAVSVAGTYIVTPEFTQGDAALFSRLVNGIISMAS